MSGPRKALVGGALVLALLLVSVGARTATREDVGDRVSARVLRVIDGDTIVVDLAGNSERIRLAEVDAPEKDQPWGREASAVLREWVQDREVELVVVAVDRYKRLVCTVYVDGKNVNRALAEAGHAWAYTDYAKDLRVIALERQAREAQRGLWALPEASRDAPWEWRRARKTRRKVEVLDPRCGKHLCKQMTSCEEARFHLLHCGQRGLDGDADGVPCESLCRAQP